MFRKICQVRLSEAIFLFLPSGELRSETKIGTVQHGVTGLLNQPRRMCVRAARGGWRVSPQHLYPSLKCSLSLDVYQVVRSSDHHSGCHQSEESISLSNVGFPQRHSWSSGGKIKFCPLEKNPFCSQVHWAVGNS